MMDLYCWTTRNDDNSIQFLQEAKRVLMMRTECRVCGS